MSTGGTAATPTVPPRLLVRPEPINGNADDIEAIARSMDAVAKGLGSVDEDIANAKTTVDQVWSSSATPIAQRALLIVQGRTYLFEQRLKTLATEVLLYAQTVRSQQAVHRQVLVQFDSLTSELKGNPGAPVIPQLQAAQQSAAGAHDTVAAAQRRLVSQMHALIPHALAPRASGGFSAVNALVADSAKYSHWPALKKHTAAKTKPISSPQHHAPATKPAPKAKQAPTKPTPHHAPAAPHPRNHPRGHGPLPKVPHNAFTFTGTASVFNDSVTATGISAASHFGVSIRRPGTAYGASVNENAKRGYWLIQAPGGKSMVLQQIDVGPNQSVGANRTIDLSQPAANALRLPGLQNGYRATFLGHDPKWAAYNGKIF